MFISRVVIRHFRNFRHLDVPLQRGVTCLIGENNTGKTNLLRAIRLAVDANLSSQFRQLLEHDIYSGVDLTDANQVLVSIEFSDFLDRVSEHALLQGCEVADNIARIHYRYRPKQAVIDAIASEEHDGKGLSIADDYHYQITGGGDKDPATVEWNEDLGASIRFGHLQAFHVEYLQALRDVTQSLRQAYESPLGRILSALDIGDGEKEALVEIMKQANKGIEDQPTIGKAGDAINASFAATAGEAYEMDVKLGMADPSFASISRSLKVLLSNSTLSDFEVSRNGLGLNNVLYISMLLDYFERRCADGKKSGQLLLIEEPESHLHPQLQRVLYATLSAKPFQSIVTTHSTHISSHSPVESFITLTNDGSPATSGCVPGVAAELTPREISDLNRYLDATRSTLLFARKVMLVEGPSEMFIIPVLVRAVMNVDLDRHGITLVPIYGTHFDVYSKLFRSHVLKKKCAIVCDGDMEHGDVDESMREDDPLLENTLDIAEDDFVQVWQCPVTFERALTIRGTADMLLAAVAECGQPKRAKNLGSKITELKKAKTDEARDAILSEMREIVLRSAESCSKGRFAQIVSKHVGLATEVPAYIRRAVEWLLAE